MHILACFAAAHRHSPIFRKKLIGTFIFLIGLVFNGVSISLAAPSPDGQQMCGDGSTISIPLNRAPIEVPDNCSIYAIFVSGYERNPELDELFLFDFAHFIAQNNGYVHYSWWNNLLKPYMAGPLRNNESNPGNLLTSAGGFVPALNLFLDKAKPDEDYEFQSDADTFIRTIKINNPDAIIIVAGHSMGGNSVVRLGASTYNTIDLLAPLDPVGNRSLPRGVLAPLGAADGAETFNWTRWRVANDLLGFRQWGCNRNSLGLCIDYDPRLFKTQYKCGPQGAILSKPPLIKNLSPLKCPNNNLPYYVSRKVGFSGNIRRLYHRWQKEAVFPFDYTNNIPLGFHTSPGSALGDPNYQFPVKKNGDGEGFIDKTCSNVLQFDPRDYHFTNQTRIHCNNLDGHGEIVGFRGLPNLPPFLKAVHAPNWKCPTNDCENAKDFLISMAAEEPGLWFHGDCFNCDEPERPHLDMVSEDLITVTNIIITERGGLPSEDTTPPISAANISIAPNSNGWNNADIVVSINAHDNVNGSGVAGIKYSLVGAQSDIGHEKGDQVQIHVNLEGTSTLTYWAYDEKGNVEDEQELIVKLDKTPPTMSVNAFPEANADNWNNEDVTVTFFAIDELSGILELSEPILITEEGEGIEVNGFATDLAGNIGSIGEIINLDKTLPIIEGMPSPDCLLWPPNNKFEKVAMVNASDTLSGLKDINLVASHNENVANDDATLISGGEVYLRVSRLGKGNDRVYNITAIATDIADNEKQIMSECTVPHDQGKKKSEKKLPK
ncbi:hypothetical protein FE810_13760 [Thalassotalea litorea]|uniref:Uncharacterized protein n=1 Tax=Thalassotalea litorea TaxID=2020715 RepID=A0A5R9IKQ3_9GAMM|nr:hypothetical protein [Thalassotalea litorea]TLU61877.1 hypothetical protein FE810_13760 [Thalassotalea litorea]